MSENDGPQDGGSAGGKTKERDPNEILVLRLMIVLFGAMSGASGWVHYLLRHWEGFPWQYMVPADLATFAVYVVLGYVFKLLMSPSSNRWKRYGLSFLVFILATIALVLARDQIEIAIFGEIQRSSSLPMVFGLVCGVILFEPGRLTHSR